MRPGRPHYLSTYLQHSTELTPNLHVTIAKFGQPACGRASHLPGHLEPRSPPPAAQLSRSRLGIGASQSTDS